MVIAIEMPQGDQADDQPATTAAAAATTWRLGPARSTTAPPSASPVTAITTGSTKKTARRSLGGCAVGSALALALTSGNALAR